MVTEDPQSIVTLFELSVPIRAQAAIVKAIETGYSAADDTIRREYDPRMWRQAWGYDRWLKVDSELLAVGARFGNIEQFRPNTEDTHLGHAELHFDKIVLTAASVQKRGQRPRHATYRELLAESNQLQLFGSPDPTPERLWGVILHVPDASQRRPLHVDVAFFAKDKSLAAPLIDLRKAVESQTRQTPTVAVPTLRLRKKSSA